MGLCRGSREVLCGVMVVSTVSTCIVNALGGSESQDTTRNKSQECVTLKESPFFGLLSRHWGKLSLLGVVILFAIYRLFIRYASKDWATGDDFKNLLGSLKNRKGVLKNQVIHNFIIYWYDAEQGVVWGTDQDSPSGLKWNVTKRELRELRQNLEKGSSNEKLESVTVSKNIITPMSSKDNDVTIVYEEANDLE